MDSPIAMAHVKADPSSVERLSTTEVYNRWAKTYDSLADPKGNTIQTFDDIELSTLLPEFLSLLGAPKANHELHIVDFGCGTGRNTFKLLHITNATIVGLDALPKMLEIAESRYHALQRRGMGAKLVLEVHDALETPAPPVCATGADAVISTCVMEHLPLQVFWELMKAMVLPGGFVLITDAHPDVSVSTQINYTDPLSGKRYWGVSHVHQFADTIKEANSAGFEQVGKTRERLGSKDMVRALAGDWSAVKC